MPDQEVETYKVSKPALAGVGFLLLVVSFLVATALAATGNAKWVLALAIVPPAAVVAWLDTIRVTLQQDRVIYSSWLGQKEMRWDDVARFYYRVSRTSLIILPIPLPIPTGTHHKFKLIDGQGRTMCFGSLIRQAEQLGLKLVEHTRGPLFQKALNLFRNKAELDFGPIRLLPDIGLRIKKTFRYKTIPWDQVAQYRMEKGYLYVFRLGERRTRGHEIARIPNAFVLVDLLNAIYRAEA